MFWILLMVIRSAISSRNFLSTMSITFGSLMNCISTSWIQLNTYFTGWSNTSKLKMSTINLTIDLHQYHYIQAFSPSLNNSIPWKAAPDRDKISGARSEHWRWIEFQFFTAPRMWGNPLRNQPLMEWWWEQCGHEVNCLYLSANKINLMNPSQH